MTIRTRLALAYSGLLIAVILVFGLTIVTISRVTILDTIDDVLDRTARDVIASISVSDATEFDSMGQRVEFETDEIFSAAGIAIQVWHTYDGDGPLETPILLRSSQNITGRADPLDTEALYATEHLHSSQIHTKVTERVVTHPLFHLGRQIGVVQVASYIQPLEDANETLLGVTVIAAAVSIAVSILLNMWLSNQTLKPINRITRAAASIAEAEDLSTRLTWDGPIDELGRLTEVFNHMMVRLERLFAVQQRFVGDVSHELRTPLTSILGNVELMMRYGADDESLEAVHREANRMSRMVNDLLMLARADYGELKVDLEPTDLEAITLEVYEHITMLTQKRSLKIKLERLESARISGNGDRLRQLMLNLVNNAIKFTPDGGTIKLATYSEGDQAVLTVTDTGIGISEKDQQHIFDRFFQADNSRTQRTEDDGAGLGLSIALWIVKSHNGKITVESAEGEGTTFRVTFPLLPKAQTTTTMHHKQLPMF